MAYIAYHQDKLHLAFPFQLLHYIKPECCQQSRYDGYKIGMSLCCDLREAVDGEHGAGEVGTGNVGAAVANLAGTFHNNGADNAARFR